MKAITLLVLLSVWCFALRTYGQVGKWTDYQSYASLYNMVDSGDKIYVSGGGGLLIYDKTDNSVEQKNSINGLSDVGVEAIGYNKTSNVVLLAYSNSNIDLLTEAGKIVNLPDLKRKQIVGNKSVNSVYFIGNLAYLSCGFGILVVNTEKQEVKDTYYIADGGGYLNVWDVTSDGTYLYAATDDGIYRALLSEPNLQDYSKWKHLTDVPHADETFNQIEYFNGRVIANYSTSVDNGDKLYQFDGQNWTSLASSTNLNYVGNLSACDNVLMISTRNEVLTLYENMITIDHQSQYFFSNYTTPYILPGCACKSDDQTVWFADKLYGLVKKAGDNFERISPEGPTDNSIFSMYFTGENLYIASGGRDASWTNIWKSAHFEKDAAGQWSVFDRTNYSEMEGLYDIVSLTADPSDPDHVFAGSWGAGIFEFKGDEFINRHSYNNSTLQSAIEGADYVRIGGMAFDDDGTLWVANGGVTNAFSSYKDGKWQSYETPKLSTSYNLGEMVVTEDGDKWAIIRRNDLFVLKNDNKTGKIQSNVAYFSNGSDVKLFEMHDIYSIALDMDGAVWVGSSNGVGVYSKPSRIWNDPETDPLSQYASQPGLNMNDGYYHPLLSNETVTAIAVDPANRKWLGTSSSGVFLVSETGEKELEHFTVENSPLLSNTITSIAINEKTGEVFFGTANGLISYMSDAIKAKSKFSDVYAYPNPVRESYSGDIIIKGLMTDTDVKIIDISGNLVYKTTSTGGIATWDGKNLNGNRCHTGVYLVLLNNSSGEETCVTKILFIH